MNDIIHSLWIGPKLPRSQHNCIESWLTHGYRYRLFVYGDVGNVPDGVEVIDGREVLKEVYLYQDPQHTGHAALHANLFRYTWLYKWGGVWVDADTTCLRRLPNTSVLISSEPFRSPPYWFADLAITRIPPRSALMERCQTVIVQRIETEKRVWGRFGPKLFTESLQALEMHSEQYVSPPAMFCPIPCWLTEEMYRPHALALPLDSYTVHVWSQSSTTKGYDLDDIHDENCFVEQLWLYVKGDHRG